jgi:hypothetical protein
VTLDFALLDRCLGKVPLSSITGLHPSATWEAPPKVQQQCKAVVTSMPCEDGEDRTVDVKRNVGRLSITQVEDFTRAIPRAAEHVDERLSRLQVGEALVGCNGAHEVKKKSVSPGSRKAGEVCGLVSAEVLEDDLDALLASTPVEGKPGRSAVAGPMEQERGRQGNIYMDSQDRRVEDVFHSRSYAVRDNASSLTTRLPVPKSQTRAELEDWLDL